MAKLNPSGKVSFGARKKDEKYSDDEIENISQKLISIHKLETREDEAEN